MHAWRLGEGYVESQITIKPTYKPTKFMSPSGSTSKIEFWTLFASTLASSMAFIDSTALNVAMPALQADFGASGKAILWILNSYLLMLAAFILVGGSAGDRLGRKRVFAAGIWIFISASLLCGIAPTVEFLILARVIQGFGGALMIPGSLAIITTVFAAEHRGKAIGTWSMIATLVTTTGPVMGGLLADSGLWRGVFLINVPLGIVALSVLGKVPESRDDSSSSRLDYIGALMAATSLGAITYGFLAMPDLGLSHPAVYGSLMAGVVILVLFVAWEYRTPHAMMPLRLFRSKAFSGTNLLTLFLYGALGVGMFFLSLNMVQLQGYQPSMAGLALLPFAALLVLLARVSGRWVDRTGARVPLMIGPVIAGSGFFVFSLIGITRGIGDYGSTFFWGMMLFGIGMGITVVPLTTAVMGSVPQSFAGTASGVNNAVTRTAGVLAIAVVGSMAISVFETNLERYASMLNLGEPLRHSLLAQAGKLGEAAVPIDTPAESRATVASIIKLALAGTFQTIMLVCACLAWTSAIMAALLVENKKAIAVKQANDI